ncbi:MAG: hypothetical protein PUB55_02385 [Bacteroidales bacterium]|nr:hypothetical protein [Bacteroidales bacterium]
MKSIKLFLLFVCLFTVQVKAQTPVVQMMEGEIRAGLTTPIGGFHTGKAEVGGDIGLEGRYNFEGTPWDCGLMLEVSSARRGFNHLFNNGNDHWQSNRTVDLAAISEYNLRQGTKINPFVGAALGVASNDVVGDEYFPSEGTTIFFAPRIGVEFLHHIRLMAQLNISRAGHNNFSFTIGFVLGGRPKK